MMQADLFASTLTVQVSHAARYYAYRVARAFGFRWRLTRMTLPLGELFGFMAWLDSQLPTCNDARLLYVDVDRAFYEATT